MQHITETVWYGFTYRLLFCSPWLSWYCPQSKIPLFSVLGMPLFLLYGRCRLCSMSYVYFHHGRLSAVAYSRCPILLGLCSILCMCGCVWGFDEPKLCRCDGRPCNKYITTDITVLPMAISLVCQAWQRYSYLSHNEKSYVGSQVLQCSPLQLDIVYIVLKFACIWRIPFSCTPWLYSI